MSATTPADIDDDREDEEDEANAAVDDTFVSDSDSLSNFRCVLLLLDLPTLAASLGSLIFNDLFGLLPEVSYDFRSLSTLPLFLIKFRERLVRMFVRMLVALTKNIKLEDYTKISHFLIRQKTHLEVLI